MHATEVCRRLHNDVYKTMYHKVPIFIQLNRLPAHVDAGYLGRVRLQHDRTSIELSGIRAEDEGWYECSVVYLQQAEDGSPNGTWVYLAVTGKLRPLVCYGKSRSLIFSISHATWQYRSAMVTVELGQADCVVGTVPNWTTCFDCCCCSSPYATHPRIRTMAVHQRWFFRKLTSYRVYSALLCHKIITLLESDKGT